MQLPIALGPPPGMVKAASLLRHLVGLRSKFVFRALFSLCDATPLAPEDDECGRSSATTRLPAHEGTSEAFTFWLVLIIKQDIAESPEVLFLAGERRYRLLVWLLQRYGHRYFLKTTFASPPLSFDPTLDVTDPLESKQITSAFGYNIIAFAHLGMIEITSALHMLGLCPNDPGYCTVRRVLARLPLRLCCVTRALQKGASGGRDAQLRMLTGLLDYVFVSRNGTTQLDAVV